MNYYEHKMLEDREHRHIAAGIALFLMAPLCAAFGGFIIALIAPSVGVVTFFALWAFLSCVGISGFVVARRERRERMQQQNG